MKLDLSAVDLDALAEALEDHSDHVRWYIDPVSGEVFPWSAEIDDTDPEERDAVPIDPPSSREGYRDMADFVDRVPDGRAADLLERAIRGRGAFRRFKDTLFEFPELRQTWFRFHDVRLRRRAISWLVDAELVDEQAGLAALDSLAEPEVGSGQPDPVHLATELAVKIREIFGPRLVEVLIFGSRATDAATPESDLDLAVVLRQVSSSWEDSRRMDDVLWEATRESGLTVSAVVVDEDDWAHPRRPFLRSAKAQGRSVG